MYTLIKLDLILFAVMVIGQLMIYSWKQKHLHAAVFGEYPTWIVILRSCLCIVAALLVVTILMAISGEWKEFI